MTYKKLKSVNRDEHVIIMEEYLGRPLDSDEIVHHVDGDKKNNSIDNLELCLRSVHSRYHQQKGDYFDITLRKKKGYKHGTYSCWRKIGCRCEACIQAQQNYKSKYRVRTGIH